MNNQLGNNIRELRRQRNLTQEQIAEAFGVSCQAISKWETNSSYPDISLLVIIADYFGVSVDYLLGYDKSKQTEEIGRICNQADDMFKDCEYNQAVVLLRDALIRHPGNEEIMYRLAWALAGTKNESQENYEESILMCHRILNTTTNVEMKTKVIRDLMYRYSSMGDYDKALSYAKQLPAFELCREYNLGRGNLLEGRELSLFLQDNILLFGNAIIECLEYFTDEKILTKEEKLPYTSEKAFQMITLLKEVMLKE